MRCCEHTQRGTIMCDKDLKGLCLSNKPISSNRKERGMDKATKQEVTRPHQASLGGKWLFHSVWNTRAHRVPSGKGRKSLEF